MKRDATISDCGRFRYRLTREWDSALKPLVFIMLNPSTADAAEDDPTIRKCIGFATRLGFGGIEVFNLFAFRATKPADLRNAGYPIGPDNDSIITGRLEAMQAHERGYVICAWGANARNLNRPRELASYLALAGVRLRALRLLADGIPEHPLMLPYSCTPVPLLGGAQ
jgi:hypothetical protein